MEGNSGIFVTKLIPGTPAEKGGQLQWVDETLCRNCRINFHACGACIAWRGRVGDQIASVNGIALTGITHAEAVKILKETSDPIHLVCYYAIQFFEFLFIFKIFILFVVVVEEK